MEFYKSKLQAFFHDPIDKPFCIQNHEKKAAEELQIIGLSYNKDANADHITSAADRINDFRDSSGRTTQVNFEQEGEITHPLGGDPIVLADNQFFLGVDKDAVHEKIFDFLNDLKSKYKEDYKKMFFGLWREFPEKVEEYNNKIGELWNYLPADTRVPDHSIVAHNFLTSAVHSCDEDIVFAKISIGPVQSFISTAKRTEDFWMGSYLLSYLISKGISIILKKLGPDHIIFPNVKGQPLVDEILKEDFDIDVEIDETKSQQPSLPNVVFFIAPQKNFESFISEIKDNIFGAWQKIANDVKGKFGFTDYASKIFDEQIKSSFEFYYASVNIDTTKLSEFKSFFSENIRNLAEFQGQYKENLGNYWAEIYEYMDKLFASNKLVRKFNYVEEQGRKCSLCGEHSAIADSLETSNSAKKLKEFWKITAKQVNSIRLDGDGADRLCASCLVKRMAKETFFKEKFAELHFPSVSSIANWSFVLDCLNLWDDDIEAKFNEYYETIKPLAEKKFSTHVFVPQNIIKYLHKKLHNNNIVKKFVHLSGEWFIEDYVEQNLVSKLKAFLNVVQKKAGKNKNIKPSIYYAVIRMDGDKMGEWISGKHPQYPFNREIVHSKLRNNTISELNKLKNRRSVSPSTHSFISKALNDFSLNIVQDIVENQFPGKLIYAGGDDVLAILPINYALQCAEMIRFAFSGQIKDNQIDLDQKFGFYVKDENKNKDKKICASMGYKSSMSAGIVFAHVKENFQSVLEQSINCEHKAKEDLGRNAFYISIMKHSGNEIHFGLKWNKKNRSVSLLKSILYYFYNNDVSMNFFSSTADALKNINHIDVFNALLKKEIHDHCTAENKKAIADEILDAFTELRTFSDDGTVSPEFIESILRALRFFASKGVEQ